ncbi:tripartite motif containing 101 isoform X2 [Nelusetta ayraudi]|uniref:tripartite motif containing 101 isoform X2 n=1 Tax=Nelusetta ayraudi TaxID=303726 RepID=UPI003F701303
MDPREMEKKVETMSDLATLQKQLICPICLQLFQKPVVILPCQHNLCRKCANELYQPSLFQARTTMTVNSGRFRCPTCRQEVVLDRHGVYGLQRNLLVENIIDAYKQEVDECNTARPSSPAAAPPAQALCLEHKGEKVNIYCLSCQVPTCSLCKVFGAHQSCEVAPLTHIYQQKKTELREELQSLLGFNQQVQLVVEQLEDTCRSIQEGCKTQRQSVCDDLQRVCSLLEERQKAMTRQITADEEEKVSRIQALMRGYKDGVEANRKLLEAVASNVDDPDMAAFIQNSKELIRNVVAAAESSVQPIDALKPPSERMKTYRYDFSCQERALRSIDFVSNVPPEAEVEPEEEPEEPKEHSKQNTEPEPNLDPSEHVQESETEPVPAQVEPQEPVESVEPLPTAAAAASSTPVSPGPGAVVEPEGAVLQGEADHHDLQVGGSHQKNKKEEEEKEEDEEEVEGEREEMEGGGALHVDKEGGTCEDQTGLNPQQAVTVLFYLLAFLLLLQRFWSYIGCFICT